MGVVRGEYPRPQMMRDRWLCLNGEWGFEEDPGLSGEARGMAAGYAMAQTINVPFCPESVLSGIGKRDFMRCVWYRRMQAVPAEWAGGRVLLHFGAVDYEAKVWVNGKPAGSHRGGYTSFSFDITDFVIFGADNEIVVRAYDDTRSGLQATGKQSERYESHGCHYTRTTGIWQTVWLESVPESYVAAVKIDPDLDAGAALFTVTVAGPVAGLAVKAVVYAEGKQVGSGQVSAAQTAKLHVALSDIRPWGPGHPFLYDVELELVGCCGEAVDSVKSYFGLRKVSMVDQAFCLNGKPLFMRMVLDQGFYPDGIYTAPTDDALRRDIELSMELGFNGARLHQKVFEPRYLYWADKLGYLVWAEYPNWGLDHSNPKALEHFLPEWLEAMERDYSHPCIIGWCPFNETPTSQNDWLLRAVWRVTKAVDPHRPVIDTSGYVHIGQTDIYDVHNYEQNVEKFKAAFEGVKTPDGQHFVNFPKRDAPYAGGPYWVSEYGGIWWNPSQTDEKAWGYGERPKTAEEFVERYRGLTDALLDNPRMCGFCYTQITDVEQEVNGLLTYDRRNKMDPAIFRAINSRKAAIEK